MYNTPLGIRTLQGAERALFVESLGMMVDNLRVMDQVGDVDVFDDLQRNQKVAILHAVARALLCGDQPPPTLTAVLEGAVASIYQHARDMLFMELEEPADWAADTQAAKEFFNEIIDLQLPTWRERVLAACAEMEVGGKLPNPDCEDRGAWELLLDSLENCVLWDTDWGLAAVLDAAPETSRKSKEELGIEDDYFTAVAPDPSDVAAERLLEELIVLTSDARHGD